MRRTRKAITVLAGPLLLCAGQSAAQAPSPSDAAETRARPLTLAERQAVWSSNKVEYRRRMLRDGKASADRWLEQQARGQTPEQRARTTPGKSKKNCKKVRWVNRATPGFGGGPMTMSRVAVCAD